MPEINTSLRFTHSCSLFLFLHTLSFLYSGTERFFQMYGTMSSWVNCVCTRAFQVLVITITPLHLVRYVNYFFLYQHVSIRSTYAVLLEHVVCGLLQLLCCPSLSLPSRDLGFHLGGWVIRSTVRGRQVDCNYCSDVCFLLASGKLLRK